MFYTAILLLLIAAVARGNITGQHPHAGVCLCLSGTGVNARDNREYQSFISMVTVALKFNSHKSVQKLFHNLSLVVSMVMSFCAVLFPTRCLG